MTLTEFYIFPHYRQTLVSSHSQDAILAKIREVTTENMSYRENTIAKYEFNGVVNEQTFQLSRVVNQPNTFLPLLKGKIESTKTGSIIFITCEMFYTTKVLLFIWTVIPVLLFLLNLLLSNGYFYALLALFFGLFNYIITVANFHRQRRISMNILDRILA